MTGKQTKVALAFWLAFLIFIDYLPLVWNS